MAPTTSAFRSSWCSVKSAMRFSTSSRKPPSWPARTMLTASSSKTRGCWAIAWARALLAVSEPELRTPAADRASKRNSAISLSRPLHHNVTRGDAGHFVDRRDSLPHLAPAVGSQGDHAVLQRLLADRPGVDALHDHFA